jgi:plasmid stabilization system protein ParE
MTFKLSPDAEQDRDRYPFHIWADDPDTAMREIARLEQELERFADLPMDGVEVSIVTWPRPVRRHYIHPFKVYYGRHPDGLDVIRLWHHARRPIER